MKQKLKTAVIGCGKVGHFHAKAYAALEDSDFVGAVNHNIGRAEQFAREYSVRAFDSVSEMIDRTGAQVVSICTPHPAHRQPALEAIRCGAHVMIEKPLATSLADCDAILDAAEKAGVRVGITCQRRMYPPCLRIKQAIDTGRLGKPIIGTATMLGWRDMDYYRSDPWRGTWEGEGGGVLVNQAPHQLDMLMWYMGDVQEVYAQWDTLNHPELQVDDTAAAVIRFKNGGIGTILVSNSQNPALYSNVHIHGDNGASVGVQTDGGQMFIAGQSGIGEPPVNDLWTIRGEEEQAQIWKRQDIELFNSVDNLYYFHRALISDFLCAVTEGRDPLVSGRDGRKAVELFTAIYRSGREGRPVRFPLESSES